MATIRDVAKIAGFSVATVSRVINQSGYVNKDTENKIKESMLQLQYTPNSFARGLASKKSDTIALIIPDITNPFFPELARAVEDTAKSFGYTLILGNSDGHEDKAFQYVNIFKQRFIDGVIFASHQLRESEVTQLTDLGIPVVTLDRAFDASITPSIQVNNYRGAVMATEHLIQIGCKKIAHISGLNKLNTATERYNGYIDTLKKNNLFNPALIVQGDFTIESGLKAAQTLLKEQPDIDGIFSANDLMAVGALKTLLRSGKKVPDDIALIGFDGITLMSLIEPEISTIAQPIYEMGSLAARQLINMIRDKTPLNEKVVKQLDTQLIVRASTIMKR
jgi:LacI family transcriptional regulator